MVQVQLVHLKKLQEWLLNQDSMKLLLMLEQKLFQELCRMQQVRLWIMGLNKVIRWLRMAQNMIINLLRRI